MGSGWKFTPFYHKCPRCQLDFSKHFVDSDEYKKYTENNERNSEYFIFTRMANPNFFKGERISLLDYRLKGMINPFPKPDEKATNGDGRSCSGWKFWQVTGTNKCENNNANNHDNLVPVVKRKLRERIIHYFLGRDSF